MEKEDESPGTERSALLIRLVLLFILGVFVVAHVPFLGAPYVNTEEWTGVAAREAYEGHLRAALATYQDYVSSPPSFVFAIVPVYALLGVTEMAARLPTLAAGLCAIIAVYALGARFFSARVGLLAGALFASNPLVFAFANVICCNDTPFTLVTALLLYAVVGATEHDRAIDHVGAGLLLGLSLIVKFNAGVYPLAIAVIVWRLAVRSRRPIAVRIARIGGCYLPGLAIPIVYYTTLVAVTGRIVNQNVAPTHISRWNEWVSLAIPRFAYYVTWIGLFSGPLLFLAAVRLWRRLESRKVRRLTYCALPINAFLIAAMNFAANHPGWDLGELRLGYLENVLPPVLLWSFQFVGLTAGEITLAALAHWGREKLWPNGVIALWTISVIVADSFWRGAQRYLVYVVPALAIFLADIALEEWKSRPARVFRRVITSSAIALGAGVGLFNCAYFAAEGHAAADLAAFVNGSNVRGLSVSLSTDVLCHCEYLVDAERFAGAEDTPRYVAVCRASHEATVDALYTSDVRLLGRVWKRYAVVPYVAGPGARGPQ
jgi:4-amino-4-deoxy-L-arabinose transferase-like glycosyltransferase